MWTYEMEAGVKINIAAGDLTEGKDFQINVFAPDKQQGQDAGLAQVAKVVHSRIRGRHQHCGDQCSNGTFSYVPMAAQEVSVNMLAGVTLSMLANMINDDSSNPGVTGQHHQRRAGFAHQLPAGA
jgi:flagellar hook-associated protein 2